MKNLRTWIWENRLLSSALLTFVMLAIHLALYFFVDLEYNWNYWTSSTSWYLVLLGLIFHDYGDYIFETYFHQNKVNAIKDTLVKEGYRIKNENKKFILFVKAGKGFSQRKLKVIKSDGIIWKIKGRLKYLKTLDRFRVQYKAL